MLLFHPIWAAADPADPGGIAFADSSAAHGNVCAWAQLTAHVRIGLACTGCPAWIGMCCAGPQSAGRTA
ncbi:hypothetical protein [Streptomyces sp. NPDC053560]|uniref:hypothetical protein n=1 Tax=Streptomyces sp. NPDC053560 TaxID=3365711 RepID=UPI0037D59859